MGHLRSQQIHTMNDLSMEKNHSPVHGKKTNPIKNIRQFITIGIWRIEHQKIKPKAKRPETSSGEQDQEASWAIQDTL